LPVRFPENVVALYSDDYLRAVIAGGHRGVAKAKEKLLRALQVCIDNHAINPQNPSQKVLSVVPPELQTELDRGVIYWYGYHQRSGAPILWLHLGAISKIPPAHQLSFERLCLLLLEMAIREFIPPFLRPERFVLVANGKGLGLTDLHLSFIKSFADLITVAYPDRLEAFYIGPTTAFVRLLFTLMQPLLPERVVAKVHPMKHPHTELVGCVPEHEIPTFFHGKFQHPSYRVGGSSGSDSNTGIANNNNNSNSNNNVTAASLRPLPPSDTSQSRLSLEEMRRTMSALMVRQQS